VRLRIWRVVDINAFRALAPLPRAPVPRPSRPEPPHTAAPLEPQAQLKRDGVELVALADGIQSSHQMAKLRITIKGLVNELVPR
jgi:hypothetical protein